MFNRHTIMRILVPAITFLSGIFVPLIIERLMNGVITDHQLTLLIITGILLSFIVLVIAFSVIFSEMHTVHKQLVGMQTEIMEKVEKSTKQFGLLVEFIVETPGESAGVTFDITRKLIEDAKKSIVFLDAWAQTKEYQLSEVAKEKRRAYYDAIIQQINKNRYSRHPFHRRIIQTSEFKHEKFALTGGSLFKDYLKKCLEIQKETPSVSVIRVAPLVINTQFIVIDEYYVIWPLLTYDPDNRFMTRHGMIIFSDPLQQFVPHIMAIYNGIDAIARKFEANDLEA